jgi:hypothetical protein
MIIWLKKWFIGWLLGYKPKVRKLLAVRNIAPGGNIPYHSVHLLTGSN